MKRIAYKTPSSRYWNSLAYITKKEDAIEFAEKFFTQNPTCVIVVLDENSYIIKTFKQETETHNWLKEGF